MFDERISDSSIDESNSRLAKAHEEDLDSLRSQLDRRGLPFDRIIRQAMKFSVALPSWGFSQGGTRFGRFPAKSEPRSLDEKMFAAALVNDLMTPSPRGSGRLAARPPWEARSTSPSPALRSRRRNAADAGGAASCPRATQYREGRPDRV